MKFLKFFFQDTGNKAYCGFVVLYILVFWIVAGLVPSIDMQFKDHLPFDCLIGAGLLTIIIDSIARFSRSDEGS